MANNNIEAYLEAILAAMEGGEIPAVPVPSWNIEKYLAAILTQLSGGGSSGGAYLINYDSTTGALDKTWNEINTALSSGQIVEIVMYAEEELTSVEYVRETGHEKFGYAVYGFGVNTVFYADGPDDYPAEESAG